MTRRSGADVRTALRRFAVLAAAGALMLVTLVLGCCDDMPLPSAASVTHHQVDGPVLVAGDCADGPAAAGAIPSPSNTIVHSPARAGNPAPVAEATRIVVTTSGAGPGRHQLCVMRT